ncbi:MAG: pilus assembly protein [Firmicutes bacterium]|nr:pilus assembly protein [Bacillota bacterium]
MDEHGTALLEFAIVLPVLFIGIWGLLAFAMHMIESEMLHFAAYNAARVALLETEQAGADRARQFLATSRKEAIWLLEGLMGMTGGNLSVTKRSNGVDVEITKEISFLDKISPWFGGQVSLFKEQKIVYGLGGISR